MVFTFAKGFAFTFAKGFAFTFAEDLVLTFVEDLVLTFVEDLVLPFGFLEDWVFAANARGLLTREAPLAFGLALPADGRRFIGHISPSLIELAHVRWDSNEVRC